MHTAQTYQGRLNRNVHIERPEALNTFRKNRQRTKWRLRPQDVIAIMEPRTAGIDTRTVEMMPIRA